ncbi:hypothetical protein [Maridesulfovibrio sp.]|uniref:hypothetical protein n=1 Tax=Maridesulfovibrio sp. TaxID=2795000 RepID=UPI003AFF673A
MRAETARCLEALSPKLGEAAGLYCGPEGGVHEHHLSRKYRTIDTEGAGFHYQLSAQGGW